MGEVVEGNGLEITQSESWYPRVQSPLWILSRTSSSSENLIARFSINQWRLVAVAFILTSIRLCDADEL